jgi:hypothetical protein
MKHFAHLSDPAALVGQPLAVSETVLVIEATFELEGLAEPVCVVEQVVRHYT